MARQFNAAGLTSIAVDASAPTDARQQALADLKAGRLRVVFSVDLFNEGVDVPSVDTVLLLRPTDSSTVFLQQLGRGLRREEGKTVCTVLDFVGHHRKEFQFQRRFGALLQGGRKRLAEQIEAGFPFLPSGCHMELDPVAAQLVLDNIRSSLPLTWRGKADELRRVADGDRITLKRFLDESGLTLDDVYSNNHCWSDLLAQGGLPVLAEGPAEAPLRRALGRLTHIDDPLRINFYRGLAEPCKAPPDVAAMTLRDRRQFHMLAAVLIESVAHAGDTLTDAAILVWQHPQVLLELGQLMEVLAERIDHVQVPLSSHPDVPMLTHARYTRREILAAFGDGETLRIGEWREGTRWLSAEQVDLLAITLDKSSGHFSPTTRYRDYAISRELLHWESQSMTRVESETGRRFQGHAARGSTVLPFARLTTDDKAFWLLGPVTYQSHEGERPMAIVWKLDKPLPGDLFSSFAATSS